MGKNDDAIEPGDEANEPHAQFDKLEQALFIIDDEGETVRDHRARVRLPGANYLFCRFAQEMRMVVKGRGIYRRSGMPVIVDKEHGRVKQLTAKAMRSRVERWVVPYKQKSTIDGFIKTSVTMSEDHANLLLEDEDFLQSLPELLMVNEVRLPVLRKSGKIELLPKGYDAETGVYTLDSIEYDTELPLEAAAKFKRDIYSEFCWGEEMEAGDKGGPGARSLSAQVAASVSYYTRHLLAANDKQGVFFYTANGERSGKTLLAKMSLCAVIGGAGSTSMPPRFEELRKLLDTAAIEGRPYLLLDNVKIKVDSGDLEAFVTEPMWEGRLFRSQEFFAVRNVTGLIITGNTLKVSGDMQNRGVWISLFNPEANPQVRRFRRVIDQTWCADENNRAQMLAALWAFVREWDAQGRPDQGCTLAGFHNWAKIVGSIVMSAGFSDPFAKPTLELAGDTDAADLQRLVGYMLSVNDGAGEWTYEDAVSICHDEGLFERYVGCSEEERGGIKGSNQKLGSYLSKREGTWYNMRLEDGTPARVRFGKRGKQRHRKYTLSVTPVDDADTFVDEYDLSKVDDD